LRIPIIYLRDKQVFVKKGGPMEFRGKPLDVAREFHEGGCKLLHIVDMDALSGSQANIDVYDALTYFINVEVECAPRQDMVRKLLSLKCRVVLRPDSGLDVGALEEKKLLVAKIPPGYAGEAAGFHDVILEDADEVLVERFRSLGKRVIIYEKDEPKAGKGVWGVISSS
jgi:hypothetical protein